MLPIHQSPSPAFFTERQAFIRHYWALLIVPIVVITTLLLLLPQSQPSDAPWPALVLLGLGLALLVTLRLDTRVDAVGVQYRLFPLQWRWQVQPWAGVQRAYLRSYEPLGEYGGWGLKGTRRNRAYNMAGSEGLQLELADGRRVLLGTQQPAKLRQALQMLPHSKPAS